MWAAAAGRLAMPLSPPSMASRSDSGLLDHQAAPPAPPLTARSSRRCRAASSRRSEEHTSELQSLMRMSYAVFCLKTIITEHLDLLLLELTNLTYAIYWTVFNSPKHILSL